MNLPLGTAGSQLSHRRCRTDDLKFRGAEETYDLVDDAKLGKPARNAPPALRHAVRR